MRRNTRVWVAFLLVIGSMVYLIASGFNSETMVYYTTVKELKLKGEAAYHQGVRVSGIVVPGSVVKATDRVQVEFTMEEEGERLQVIYQGVLPDTFKEGAEVLVEGQYQPDGTLLATNVFTKCASKYEPAEESSTD